MNEHAVGSAPVKPKITRRRPVQVCTRCRTRRTRCDRLQPSCSACLKSGRVCVYLNEEDSFALSRRRQQELATAHVGSKPANAPPDRLVQQRDEVSSAGGQESIAETKLRGHVLAGQEAKYFSPFSWASATDNITDISQVLKRQPNGHNTISEHGKMESSPWPSAFPCASGDTVTDAPLLDDNLSVALLQIYVDRVDCIIKVIHLPSFLDRYQSYRQLSTPPTSEGFRDESLISPFGAGLAISSDGAFEDSQRSPETAKLRTFEPLLMAVYYAAAVAAESDPSLQINEGLTSTYRRAAENALQKANFLESEDLETLQALILLLSVFPRAPDPRTPWIQLGIAVRIAQTMGIHRDGSQYGLDPLETEVRRRLWAQIRMLDLRAAEELGCEPTILEGSYDTCLPSNISDDSLSNVQSPASPMDVQASPSTVQGQSGSVSFSSMTFSLIRFEAALVLGKLLSPRYRPKDSPYDTEQTKFSKEQDKLEWVDRLERRYQTIYRVNALDMEEPQRRITSKVASILLARARFIANLQVWKEKLPHLPREENDQRRHHLFVSAVSIMEETADLIVDQALGKWSWYSQTFNKVYAAAFVLSNLMRGGIEQKLTLRCWAAFDILFPEEQGNLNTQSKYRTSLHNLVIYAREKHLNETRAAFFGPVVDGGASAQGGDFTSGIGTGIATDGVEVGGVGESGAFAPQDAEVAGSAWIDDFVDEMVGSRFAPWSDLTEFLLQ